MASCDHCWNVVDDNVVDFDRASRIKQDLHLLQVQDTTDATLTDDHYMLLPDSVDAFVLRERDIFAVYIENIEDLDGDKTGDQEILKKQSGFGELVLPEGHGELVEALVKSHPSTRRPRGGSGNKLQIDLTKGKGEGNFTTDTILNNHLLNILGLIILLHGVPGVGKTSTAECVAAYTGRPLYPITCANIGLDPEEVEKNLTGPGGHFRRAQQWNCVVLLDEADVFLAKRESGDTDSNRNALVSVFLRIVEFYQGILILTTNRVGSFDEAFVSRVQLFLYYPPLSHDQTLKVWQVNINRTRESGVVILDEDDEEAIITFAKEELSQGRTWNGRQIRNYFQTAISLSEYDVSSRHLRDVRNGTKPADSKPSKPRLSDKNIKKIAKATGKFIDYINTVLPEKSHEKQSRDEGMRNDAFGMTPRKSKRPE
jgi:DNA polymerase III delta prime subunit